MLDDVHACALLGYAAEHLDGCAPDCPWRGIAGPGITPQSCDLAAVLACVDAVAAVNECPHLAATVDASCAVDACHEVE